MTITRQSGAGRWLGAVVGLALADDRAFDGSWV